MCEILNENFVEKFSEISSVISKCAFIAIDTEFTGLKVNADDHINLFDSAKERYTKLRAHANSFIICQFGLSAFLKNEDENRYDAHTYNFYICPRSQGIFDTKFHWQASCIEFLSEYKFDFNKFAYHGLSYLNYEKEIELRKKLKSSSFLGNVKSDADDYEIKYICSLVTNWLVTSSEVNEELVVHVSRHVSAYIIHKEIRSQFGEVWTFYSNHNEILVKKVSSETRLELQNDDNLDEAFIEYQRGFSKVFNSLVVNKKPLVGHNLMTDLIFMYNQFYKSLPKSYDSFKSEITFLFPEIYDTKHIAIQLSKTYPNFAGFQSSVLSNLYAALTSQYGRFYAMHSPTISHAPGFLNYQSDECHHEAGFDAYISGYAFLRMAHICFQGNSNFCREQRLTFNNYSNAMKPYCCYIALMRGNINAVNLKGNDPTTTRPKWLVLESRNRDPLSTSEIMETCSKHGSVDVRLINPYKAIVAISSYPGLSTTLRP